ncbi:MAG: T9SS type A sorting domain-containing protein [Flavobacteriales bacterium]|nr:T9SS type A sorting domain-containing protein [Flavobacteriales bacterium]
MIRPVHGFLSIILLFGASHASGQFGAAQLIHSGSGNVQLRSADIDVDGDEDLFGVFNGHLFKWFENLDGSGTFGTANMVLNLGNDTEEFVLADVDGDLDPDILVIPENENNVLIYTNDGAGAYTLSTTLTTPSGPKGIACADIHGDGHADIIVTLLLNGGAGFGIFPGAMDGFGEMEAFTDLHDGPPSSWVAVGDLDLIGGLDILLRAENDVLTVARNTNGDGTVFNAEPLSIPDGPTSYSYHAPQLLDVDADGDLDLAESRGPAVHWLRNGLDEGGLLSFSENVVESWSTGGSGTFGASPCGPGACLVYVPNDPNLPVRWNSYLPELNGFPYSNDLSIPRGQGLLLADFNDDGREDLVMTRNDGVSWFPNIMNGQVGTIKLPVLDTLCVNGAPVQLPDVVPTGGRWYGTQVSNDLLFRANLGVTMDLPLVHAVYATEGCPMAAETSIRLIDSPVITTTIPSVICSADPMIELHSVPSNVNWYGLDGSDVIDPATWNGGYIVCEFTDGTGLTCADVQGPILRWNTLPASIAEAGPFCTADQVQTIVAQAAPPTNVTWSGPVSGSTPMSTFFDPAQGPGVYTIVLTVDPYGPNQCGNSDTLHIAVHPTPTIGFTQPAAYCAQSDPIALDWVTPEGGFWSGTGVNGNVLDPSVAGPGIHLLSYFTISNEGCGAQSATTIELADSIALSPLGVPPLLCNGDAPITFTASPTGGSWDAPLGIDGLLDPAELTPGSLAVIYRYTDPRGCVLTNPELHFTVGAPKVVSIAAVGELCSDGDAFDLIGSDVGVWSGAVSGEGLSILVDPTELGVGPHAITLTITPMNECPGSATVEFVVDICSSIDARTIAGSVIAPNPFQETTGILFRAEGAVHLEVFNAAGQLVFADKTMASGSTRMQIDLRDQAPGVYVVRLITADGTHQARVIKSN